MSSASEDGAAPPARSRARPRLLALAGFGAIVLATGAAWLLAWRGAERALRASRAREIASVVALKVEQVVRWREERLSDAQLLAHDPNVADALTRPGSAHRALDRFLRQIRGVGDYTGAALVDRDGRIVDAVGAIDRGREPLRALLDRALARRAPVMSDLEPSEEDPPHIDVLAAFEDGDGRPVGAALLRVDPRPYLFRVVAAWNEPGRSAELLLLRAESGGAVAIEPDRAGGATARFPPGGAIAAAVARRAPTELQALDHRGVDVIGAAAPVPASPWVVLVTEDAADTLAPIRERAITNGIAVLGVLVGAAAVAAYAARRQEDRLERLRAIAAAERSVLAARLARLTTHAQDMVLVADESQRIVDANERAVALLGYTRAELLGKEVREIRDPSTLDDYPDRLHQQLRTGAALFETRYRRKDGSIFPVAVSVHADEHDGRRWFEAIARDISDRKRAEDALRDSEAKFRAAFEFASIGVVLVGADRRIIETNRAFRHITGYAEDELRGAPIALLNDPAEGGGPEDLAAGLEAGERDRLEVPRRLRRKDGTLAETSLRASALRDATGKARLFIAVIEDVSEKKRLEAQLLLADRMASVGMLAAGVAHEINNPLAFILSNLDFALGELRRAAPDPEVLRALEDARDGGVRVRAIVRDLNAFSRPAAEVREALDPRAVLESAIGLASNELRHRARISVEPGEVPRVAASEYRLGQVLLNLLVNAAQAIPEGHAADNLVRAATSTAPDGSAVIEVSDTGIGIAPELLPRIFDPFYTTKPPGVGTGLGLSICHGIVTQLGGTISVESVPGKGSTFRVSLPPARGSAPPRAAGA